MSEFTYKYLAEAEVPQMKFMAMGGSINNNAQLLGIIPGRPLPQNSRKESSNHGILPNSCNHQRTYSAQLAPRLILLMK